MTYFNRLELLRNTLMSIYAHDVKPYEIIIIDDGSDKQLTLDDIPLADIDIKLLCFLKSTKTWVNPCIAYNQAFSMADGDAIIIQNSECLHYTNIVKHVIENIKENDYFSYSCYSANLEETTNKKYDFAQRTVAYDGDSGWYNHSAFRPTKYHFCSAMTKSDYIKHDLKFNEVFKNGIGFDDNAFIWNIENKKMNAQIIDSEICIHQFHYTNSSNPDKERLVEINKNIFNRLMNGEIL